MKVKLKYFLFGTIVGVFISGLTIVFIEIESNRSKTYDFFEASGLSKPPTDKFSACQNLSDEIVSSHLKIDINLSTLEELKTLPGIGDVKAKSIIDFRQKYGNFTSIDELLYVPGIGNSIFQQICNLVAVNFKDNE